MLKGRRVVLVGVADESARRYSGWLHTSGSTCENVSGDPLPALAGFDAVVLGVGGGTIAQATERTLIETCRLPLLAMGAADALSPMTPFLRRPTRDFAIEPCSESEFGLRISVLLPLADAVHPPQPRTIVVADDDRVTRAMIEAWLVKGGFTCHAVGNGEDALALTRRLRPDVVILDLYMPRRNGLAVLQEIRNDPAIGRTRVLMLTGSAEQENVRRASELRADGYLVKPFQAAKLVDRITALLDHHPS